VPQLKAADSETSNWSDLGIKKIGGPGTEPVVAVASAVVAASAHLLFVVIVEAAGVPSWRAAMSSGATAEDLQQDRHSPKAVEC